MDQLPFVPGRPSSRAKEKSAVRDSTPKSLQVSDLHVHYRKICALREVNFTAEEGESIAVIGKNGAGKSTLLKSLAGLISDAAGEVLWNNTPLTQGVRRQSVAYLPQREEIDLNFPITVSGLVDMGLYPCVGALGRFTRKHREAAAQAISTLGLEGLEKRRIGELSGGQQQRTFLARALAGGARILLLDEPFAGLDATAQQNLSQIIQKLTDIGCLILAAHHYLKSIPSTFDKTLLLRTRQLAYGPSPEILTPEQIRSAFE